MKQGYDFRKFVTKGFCKILEQSKWFGQYRTGAEKFVSVFVCILVTITGGLFPVGGETGTELSLLQTFTLDFSKNFLF